MYQGKVYRTDGGDRIVIAEGGAIEVEALAAVDPIDPVGDSYSKAEVKAIVDAVNKILAALQGYIPGEE